VPAGTHQLTGPAQNATRVTAETDVAVGKKDGAPAAHPRQPLEHITPQRRGAAAAGQLDGGLRLVDAKRGYPQLRQVSDETPWTATQVDRRPLAHREHRLVERPIETPTAR
jgi:hypothetical protein